MTSFKGKLKRRVGTGSALVAVVLLATACTQIKPLEYTEIHDIQTGPGLLSDDQGAFVLYSE